MGWGWGFSVKPRDRGSILTSRSKETSSTTGMHRGCHIGGMPNGRGGGVSVESRGFHMGASKTR